MLMAFDATCFSMMLLFEVQAQQSEPRTAQRWIFLPSCGKYRQRVLRRAAGARGEPGHASGALQRGNAAGARSKWRRARGGGAARTACTAPLAALACPRRAVLQCYSNAALQHYSVTVLHYYNMTVLQYFSISVFQ